MALHYPNPALEAELAYRHELIRAASRRGSWLGTRRPHRPAPRR